VPKNNTFSIAPQKVCLPILQSSILQVQHIEHERPEVQELDVGLCYDWLSKQCLHQFNIGMIIN
jgi:hypothetical protein